MLGLPQSTDVNRRVAKEKLYSNAALTPKLRETIKDAIEVIVWRNKLAGSTFNMSKGEAITELQVFEVQLRRRELDKKVLAAIAKAIPYKILFILTFGGQAQAWIEVSGTFYNTDWLPLGSMVLRFNGQNLDAVYENLARQIADERLGTDENITDAVERDKQRRQLEREITALEKKILREKQFNKQVEMNGELKWLMAELEGMK